ncbi:MAG: hypothetical protein RBQ74_07705, partial [Defluviitoga tunisiensis]|nr:hypothetical protein [Defluviitoga tunisiensis]
MIIKSKIVLKKYIKNIYFNIFVRKKNKTENVNDVVINHTADMRFSIDFISKGKISNFIELEGWVYSQP